MEKDEDWKEKCDDAIAHMTSQNDRANTCYRCEIISVTISFLKLQPIIHTTLTVILLDY